MNPHAFSPWLLIAALVCFLMPFFNVSCSDQNGAPLDLARINGVQLVTGTTSDNIAVPNEPVAPSSPGAAAKPPEKVPAVPLAALDAVLVIVAAVAFWAGARRGPLPGVIATALAIGTHLWLPVYMQNDWLAAQMKAAPATSAASAGPAMASLSLAQTHVSAGVGWYTVGTLMILAVAMQFLPRAKT